MYGRTPQLGGLLSTSIVDRVLSGADPPKELGSEGLVDWQLSDSLPENLARDHVLYDQDPDELTVLGSERYQFTRREIVGFEAPTGRRVRPASGYGTGAILPSRGQVDRLDRDAVYVKTERLVEVSELAQGSVDLVDPLGVVLG